VLIVRDMREKRKPNSTTYLRHSEKNCMEKEGLRERYGTTKTATKHSSKQETAAVAKPQRQQEEETETETETECKQASKQGLVTTTVRTFCSATNNTATTTQQRRNRDAQKDKSLKDAAGLHRHHHHHHRG
jgi:hypothetical protein